jgi:hypothetical protein
MTSLVYGFIRAAQDGWSDTVTIAAFVAAVVPLSVFLSIETRTRQPITPLHMFRDRKPRRQLRHHARAGQLPPAFAGLRRAGALARHLDSLGVRRLVRDRRPDRQRGGHPGQASAASRGQRRADGRCATPS